MISYHIDLITTGSIIKEVVLLYRELSLLTHGVGVGGGEADCEILIHDGEYSHLPDNTMR